MILEKQTEAIILQEGLIGDSIEMSLDLDSAQVLMQMLSKNLYSDAIGSTVRECTSNALDSHRRINTDKPIIVSFKPNTDNNYEFSVEDFGTGLDDDDVRNILSKYGKSTKRNSNVEIGAMGLGFKAPLAYSSSFYFVCRKDGVERKYMMYEGEEVNSIDLLYEKQTTENNGVKIIISVKYYDRREFYNKIAEQLAYFENVYFDCGEDISNNFNIFRSEDFQFSELSDDSYMHISLDNVYYPLDFQKLGIEKLYFPVALKFSLSDGIFPTPNRESIRYTKEAKSIILKKIETVSTYFIEKFNESIIECEDLISVISYYNEDAKYYKFLNIDKKFNINLIKNFTKIKIKQPILKNVKDLDISRICFVKDQILGEYVNKFTIRNGRMSENKNHYHSINITNISSNNYYIYNNRISGIKKEYIKQQVALNKNTTVYLVKKNKKNTLGSFINKNKIDYNTYYNLLELQQYPKNKWRQLIQEFQYALSTITKHFINIDDIIVPESFIDARKKVKITTITSNTTQKRIKLKGDIIGKMAVDLERYVDGKNCKWVSKTYKLEDISKTKSLIVYGGNDDIIMMDELFNITNNNYNKKKKKVEIVQFSERELKNLENVDIHNLIKFKTFMEGKNKPFKRLITAYLIHELIKKNPDVFEKKDQLSKLSKDLSDKLNILENYKKEYYCHSNVNIYTAMLDVAKDNNLYDEEMFMIYKEINNICNSYIFLQPLCDKLEYYQTDDSQILNAISDLFKYYKKRIDWKNYKIKMNQDEVVEPLIED
jgi:hypothetical protein